MSEATVHAIASGKGGVGKTTVAVNVAAATALTDAPCLLVDVDLGMANVGAHLGVDEDVASLHDVLADRVDLAEAIHTVDRRLDVLPGSRSVGAYGRADPDAVLDVLTVCRERYDRVVVDTGAGLHYDNALPIAAADRVVLVAAPTATSAHDTAKTAEVADRTDTPVQGVVVNRVPDDPVLAPAAVAERVSTPALGTVPDSPGVPASQAAGVALVWHAPGDPAAVALREVAAEVTGLDVPAPPAGADPGATASAGDDADASRGLLARLFGW